MPTLRLQAIPVLADNYVWLLADDSGNALVVDPGEAGPVLEALTKAKLRLGAILLTHHHPDHIGGVPKLLAHASVPVYAPDDARIETATAIVRDGDRIALRTPALEFEVIAVPGHTSSHIVYVGHGHLFCGDTLFSVGCGRIFEGTPTQMLASLDRLAALPPETLACCGHEYTVANCAFARTLDPDNHALAEREEQARKLRAGGAPTLPVTIAQELACNPFLRVDSTAIVAAMASDLSKNRVERFAALRQRKDEFRAPSA